MLFKPYKHIGLAASVAAVIVATAPAAAIPIFVTADTTLTRGSPYSFSFGGNAFTFSSTGDIFNPLAVQTGGGAAVSSFGGFLGIPVSPTSFFTNRGTVSFGPNSGSFASFGSTTTVPYSNGDNFIGLRATLAGQNYYGFAYTTNNIFNGFGFETTANTAITATTSLAAVPEPASWAMMIAGFGAIGAGMRRRRPAAMRPA